MSDLRKSARGRDCAIRSPVCSFNPEETVLAHVRMIGVSGMGSKAPDLLGAFSCARCHQLVDTGRYQDVELTKDDRDLYLLKGVMRTQAMWIKEGLVKV